MEAAASDGENHNLNNDNINKISNSSEGLSKPKRQMKTPFQLETLEKAYALETYPSVQTHYKTDKRISKKNPSAREFKKKSKNLKKEKKKMCLVFVCDEDQRVLSRQPAPGACPFCGGMIQATDVESQWRFCFVPLYWKTKRKFYCTMCTRQLVMQ